MNSTRYGYKSVLSRLEAEFRDLNNPAPYPDFEVLTVTDPYNFNQFRVNAILKEADVYVSIAKMKCHYTAGITLSMKNNVGMVPGYLYSGAGGG